MKSFGWSRLGYLSVTLVLLAMLVKLGSLGAASLPDVVKSSDRSFAETTESTSEVYRDIPLEIPDSPATPETSAPEEADEEDQRGDDHAGHAHDTVTTSIYENVDFEKDAPVFYRPAPARGVSGARSAPSSGASGVSGMSGRSGEKMCRNVSAAPDGAKIVFPLTKEYFDSYDDTWGAARPQGGHEGTDLMTPDGVPEFAITDGTVTTVSGANGNGWNELGGYTVMVRADYSIGPVKEGDLFYYAHMNKPTDLEPGDRVRAGDVVGYSGDTGQGPEVTSGLFPPHLHLGWYDVSSGRSQLASGAMNPYPLLEWIKANGGSIEGGSDIPYCEGVQPSVPVPSDGGSWQFPSDPGVRPDMDTGTGNATPSPDADPIPSAESSPNTTKEEVRDPKPADADKLRQEIREDAREQVDEAIRKADKESRSDNGKPSGSNGSKDDGGNPSGGDGSGNGPNENDDVAPGEGRPDAAGIRNRIRELREEIETRIRKQVREATTPDRPDPPERPENTAPEVPAPDSAQYDKDERDTNDSDTCSREGSREDSRNDRDGSPDRKDRDKRGQETAKDCEDEAETTGESGDVPDAAPAEVTAPEKSDEDQPEDEVTEDKETTEKDGDPENGEDPSEDDESSADPTGQYTEPTAIEATGSP